MSIPVSFTMADVKQQDDAQGKHDPFSVIVLTGNTMDSRIVMLHSVKHEDATDVVSVRKIVHAHKSSPDSLAVDTSENTDALV